MVTDLLLPKVDRRTFIGGSDAAGVLGCSRWETPLSIWAKKTGQLQESVEETLPMKLGKMLEPTLAELFTEHTGLKVRRVNQSAVHPVHKFLAAQIDREVVGDDSLCELKTASGWKAKEWSDEEIPQEYIIQVMHQLAVTGKKKGYVAVLIGGNQDFKVKEIPRDEELIRQIVAKEVAFWNDFVVPRVMPKVTKDDAETLYRLFPLAVEGSAVDLGDEGARLMEMRQALYQDRNSVEMQLEAIENQIKALLKDSEAGKAGKWIATWKNQVANRLDTKALKAEMPQIYDKFSKESPSRPFRIKEASNGKH